MMTHLTPGELQVMRILWEHGELKPPQIQDKHSEPIKNSALRSYLTILVEKGHVTRRRRGRAYYYRAKTRRQTVLRSRLRLLVDVFFGGSTRALISNLIREEDFSPEELLELKKMAEEEK